MALPIDAGGLKELGQKVFDAIDGFLREAGVPGVVSQPTAGVVTGIVMVVPALIAAFVQGILGLGTFFAVNILGIIGKARTENARDFNEVIAASMSELLGVEINPDDLPTGQGAAAMIARVQAIGGKLHDQLINEFVPSGQVSPESGEKAARAFTGYAINFAVATSFIAILSESVSIGFLKNFRELGESVAQSLGLGRLQRLALQPLIRNTIQQPYDLFLKKQYRPDRLTEAQYVRGLNAGAFDESYVRDRLAEKGYPDAEINRLIFELSTWPTASELYHLVRYGDMSLDDAVKALNAQGIAADTARQQLRVLDLQRVDAFITQYVNVLEKQVLHGKLDLDGFNKLLDQTPWSEQEKFWEKNYLAAELESPSHLLTLAQVKTGILQGILDFNYFDDWAQSQGYDTPEALVLEYEILLALDAAATKDQAAQAAAARKAQKAAAVRPS